MKRLSAILFSPKTSIVLLILSGVAMAAGTFVEDKYDTVVARHFVYNTFWFELLFILLSLNFLGHIKPYHMFRIEKAGGLVFHLALFIMIIGAGITRYFGFEGTMHIREGESSSVLYSSDPYLRIALNGEHENYSRDFNVNFNPYLNNTFSENIHSNAYGEIGVTCKAFISNAIETVIENTPGGSDIIELVVGTENRRENVFLENGTVQNIRGLDISYNNDKAQNGFRITGSGNSLQFKASCITNRTNMKEQSNFVIPADSLAEFREKSLYSANNVLFAFPKFHPKSKRTYLHSTDKETGSDALLLEITNGGKSYEADLLFLEGQTAEYRDFTFDGLRIRIAYGRKPIDLPFSLHLNDFILERYAGSDSPSSYASEVTVIDPLHNINLNHRIFMNNVLDYGGYRFFQSSYDPDEKGTILSVNHDFWGTWTSYFGYMLLAAGFILTLFNSTSRFQVLRRSIVDLRKKRKSVTLIVALLVMLSTTGSAQEMESRAVSREHAAKFGQLITQTINGRFEPVNSLAYDVLHKITRKDKFSLEGKNNLDPVQVFMDMFLNPEYWKQQKIIYIKEQSVRDLLGLKTKEAAFIDFFDTNAKYRLQEYAEKAFRKKPADQNNFDKEILKLDERANVFMMVFQGSILKLFPDPNAGSATWASWDEKSSLLPLPGVLRIINEDLQLPELTYNSLMQAYLTETEHSMVTGDYSKADKILGYISSLQRQGSAAALLPSPGKITTEIYYNKAGIFILLRNVYSVLSLGLLLLAFIDNVRTRKSRIITLMLNACILILAVAFLYQTFGMILRAYILGYAPWSNGYEALLLVAWGTLLAGFSFVRYSKITLAATCLLAFFILMTASHSSYDPQLTVLSPVLKSYWLIIHVAVLTISYGFLGLGFILGIMNLFLYIFKTKKNYRRLDLLILELTHINEMNITVGIVLATIGTFLGGVWANESWGRYWGWDAKETWALIIVITYTLLLHIRFIPGLKSKYTFNVGTVLSFGSVLMTFFGVNYFLSKGMHSYGAGDHAIFPLWAWIGIASLLALMVFAKIRDNTLRNEMTELKPEDGNV
ncbi:MAG: cytochrome c biogenesis protein CcsA [Bacteroidia bacterium]